MLVAQAWAAEIRRPHQASYHPGLHKNFQATLNYRVRQCLKIKTNKHKNTKKIETTNTTEKWDYCLYFVFSATPNFVPSLMSVLMHTRVTTVPVSLSWCKLKDFPSILRGCPGVVNTLPQTPLPPSTDGKGKGWGLRLKVVNFHGYLNVIVLAIQVLNLQVFRFPRGSRSVCSWTGVSIGRGRDTGCLLCNLSHIASINLYSDS